MHVLPLAFLTLACVVDNGLTSKEQDPEPFDTGEPVDTIIDTEDTDPAPPEECNGVDDDGDGEIDEGFPDENGNGQVDCLDQECPTTDLGVAGTVPIVEECEGTTSSSG